MLIPVEETASASRKCGAGERTVVATVAAVLLIGIPVGSGSAYAQIVPGGANAPKVQQTANGLPQVNVNRPSAAGVSMNSYSQFDVQKNGAVINNSPTVVNTQIAGYVNGNPNYAAGRSARIIVNQVNSANPSQLNGPTEIAGKAATFVLANPQGISINGGGFINAPRVVLTTGVPNLDANGALAGYTVTGGSITVSGAGFNASNVDQVDLLARAVQANAAIHAKNLNVIAGANSINHDTLAATPITGNGAPSPVSIDVSQLGGMYAGKILLSSNEFGVGVSNAGVIAAQAGDFTLSAGGVVTLTGRTTASGNVILNASQGINNSGTTYAQQSLVASTGGALANSGTMAAQGGLAANAGSIASSGTLGAGVNGDGVVTEPGALNLTTTGALSATGTNLAGGDAVLAGASLNLAGSETSATGNMTLAANAGDANLAGANVKAGQALATRARGAVTTDHATLSSGGSQTLDAAALSNRAGQIISGGALSTNVAGAADNTGGVAQAAGAQSINAGSLDNTGGHILSLNADGLNLVIGSALVNGAGGVIGGNGNVSASANTFTNVGQFSALHDAVIRAWGFGNSGSVTAGGLLSASATGALSNVLGTLSGGTVNVSGASIDNTKGDIDGTGVSVATTGDLVNRSGTIAQSGSGAQTLSAGGKLDNSAGGKIASNATDLSIKGASVDNDSGAIQHAGAGKFDVSATGATGAVSSVSGKIASNGSVAIAGQTVDTSRGSATARQNLAITAQRIVNEDGKLLAGQALNASASGALDNRGGTVSATTTKVAGGSIDNTQGDIEGVSVDVTTPGDLVNVSGKVIQSGTGAQALSAGGKLDNSAGGTIASNATDLSIKGATVDNDSGAIQHAGAGKLDVSATGAAGATGAISNVSGKIASNGAITLDAANIDNRNGSATAQRAASVNATNGIDNASGLLYGAEGLSATTGGDFNNAGGNAQTGGNLDVSAGGAVANASGAITANGAHGTAHIAGQRIDNTNGAITNAGDGATNIASGSAIANAGGVLGGNGDVDLSGQTLDNTKGGQVVAGGAANLGISERIDNQGGTAYGGTALNVGQSTTTVVNDDGTLLGGTDVKANVASFSNAGGKVRANRDIDVSGAVSGDGEMTAGRNLALDIAGDYANGAANSLNADGDMSIRASGTLRNAGQMAAGGSLDAVGANVVNEAGADMNSSNTTVSASGSIDNAGVIEGDKVTTNSTTLNNTGAVFGNTVTVNAYDVINSGAAAIIAGASWTGIYAQNSVQNLDGAFIYSGGNLEMARDGTRDASGLLANPMNVLTNSASSIQAEGDIDVAAHTLNNLRTGVVTEAGTPVSTTSPALTLWTADMGNDYAGPEFAYFQSYRYPWRWWAGGFGTETRNALATPLTVTLPASQVTNLDTGAQTFSLTTPLTDRYEVLTTGFATRTVTNNATQYYNSLTQNADGTVTITFWPDFDPNTQIRPDQVQVRTDLGTDNHDYIEIARTTTTTMQTDRLLNAGTAANMVSQGTMRINSDGGAINNESSTMAAGGDLIRRADGGSVNDDGIVLQQTGTETTESTFYWHQKSGRNADLKTFTQTDIPIASTTVAALPAIASSNQTVDTQAQDINVTSVDRKGQTVTGSGVSGGNATGTQVGSAATGGGEAASVAATGDSTKKPQTLGTASGGIPDLKLPVSALYTYDTAPGTSFLIETNPRFTSYTKFISSDYMLGQLGINPANVEKRLGDAYYETQLIRNQVTQLTGRVFLSGYSDNLDEYTALMNNGVAYSKAFNLTVGVGLSDAQMAQLTTDMVWLVSQSVTLANGSTQTVLVPKLYLAQSNTVDLTASGAIVTGNKVVQNASGNANISGVVVGDVATTVIGNNIVNRGVIGSGGTTTVAAVEDVNNIGGQIGGVATVVSAGHDINNVSVTQKASTTAGTTADFEASASGMAVTAVATISGANSVTAIAGHDVNLSGSVIKSGGDATLAAANNIHAGTVQLDATQDVGTRDGLNGGHKTATVNVGSAIAAAGNVTTVSGGDTTLVNTTVKAGGDVAMGAVGNLSVGVATDAASYNGQSMGGSLARSKNSTYDETVKGSTVQAGGSTTLVAGQGGTGNLNIAGSTVSSDKGATTLSATGDVNIGSVDETHTASHWEDSKHSGFLSSTKTTDTSNSHDTYATGSTVSGDTVTGAAGHDMTITGSTVAATHDLGLAAGNNLTVTTSQDKGESSTFHEEKRSGFGALSGGGASLSYGTRDQKDTTHDSYVSNNSSLVGSTDGSVSMIAGSNLTVRGSDVIAAQNVTGTGANVSIEAAQGTTHHDEQHEMKQSGFTLGLSGSVGDAINNAISETENLSRDTGKDGNSRAAALHGIAAAGDVAMAGMGAKALAGGATGQGAPSIGVQLSFGTSQSRSDASEDQTTHSGSSVRAGGTAAFVATGDGTPGSGNVTIAGSDVNANDVLLAANNQVNVINTTDTDSTRSSNSSSSASVGVSYGTQGFGVSAAMSNAHGDANSDASIQNASHVTGANSVNISSGGDTNVLGSQVAGKQISADVGGNLNIESVQDKTSSAAHQSSVGGGFSISQGGGSASISAQNGQADSNYAGVNEQAGLYAGDGGYDVNVKGNTALTGAVISSTADASKNSLTTGSLTYADIDNHSHYSANSFGGSFGLSPGGSQEKAVGPASVPGSGGLAPMIAQHENGDESATTRSAVSTGTINITNGAAQTQDVAGLSRDTANTNGNVSAAPDVNQILNKQADMMQAAQAAGQAVSQGIGAYADGKKADAQKVADAAKAAGDMDAYNAAMADVKSWAEGGANRIALHIAGGGLIGGLGGGGIGSAATGAAGAGVAAWAAGDLNRLANGTRDALGGGDAAQLAGNVSANILAGGMGALVGGGAGAFAASNADLYNRSTGNGNGQGSTANSALGWIGDQIASAGRGAENLANQFAALVNANGSQGSYVSPDDLNGPGGNSKPPAAGGSVVPVAVCVPPVCTVVPAVTPGTPGYAPGNATLNSGNGDQPLGGKSVNDLSDAAKAPDASDKSGELSAAGRGLQKHGSRDDSAFPAAKGNPAAINEQGQKVVDEILNDPGRTVEQLNRGRYGNVIEIRASDGRGIRYGADGRFIGFLEPNK